MADNWVPLFYGACIVSSLALAVLSGRVTLIKTGLLLLLAWAGCNLIIEAAGHAGGPMIIPSFDALIAIAMGGLALTNRNVTAGLVFGLFVFAGFIHVLAFQAHTQGTYNYYYMLNLIYLAQVVVVGGASGWAVVDRLRRGPLSADPHPSRG